MAIENPIGGIIPAKVYVLYYTIVRGGGGGMTGVVVIYIYQIHDQRIGMEYPSGRIISAKVCEVSTQ